MYSRMAVLSCTGKGNAFCYQMLQLYHAQKGVVDYSYIVKKRRGGGRINFAHRSVPGWLQLYKHMGNQFC